MKKIWWMVLPLVLTGCALLHYGIRPGARAVLTGTAPDSHITGTVTLSETAHGLRMVVQVKNVPPGTHGFHIHENGSCDDMGRAAGGHYNPAGVKHGYLPKDGLTASHAGDFGNISVGHDGTGRRVVTMPGLTLTSGKYPVVGKAFILHAKADDLTSQPTGNAGDRIACGVIVASGQ